MHPLMQDVLFLKARRRAENDGRLHYIVNGKIVLRKPKTDNFLCVGAQNFSRIVNGVWNTSYYEKSAK